jgi:Na+-transporting NADH:ubiquinone oxidoreductase subunit B
MQMLRKMLDSVAPHFEEGGKLHKFHAIYEMPDTILFTPGTVTKGGAHVRDAINLKRMMITVVIALQPCFVMAAWNTGYQANNAIAMGGETLILDNLNTTVFHMLMGLLGVTETMAQHDPSNHIANFVYGLCYFVPIFAVTQAAGGLIEVITSIVRKHEVNEGFLVSGALIPLILPPTIPLWQVFIGTCFGILIGKEVFGGTGMNILNPALVARAFLFFAYPAQISGDAVWIAADTAAVDTVSGATWLANAAVDANALEAVSWFDAFVGMIPGSMGETSALAVLMGMGLLLATRVASWQTMAGVALGTVLTSLMLNGVGSDTNPMFAMPFWWHMVLGGWAIGAVFMATDPVSSSFTVKGKWAYGFGIGLVVVLVRVVNPAYPEGMMLAILFMNLFAPLFDHFVVQANIKRRLARNVAA